MSLAFDVDQDRTAAVAGAVASLARGERQLRPPDLLRLVSRLCRQDWLWRPVVRHDPDQRWWLRLFCDDRVDVWLLGWDVGQDTTLHDHGGSGGAFAVAEGVLAEGYSARDGAPLARRQRATGTGSAFGPRYVHVVANEGPVLATSIHAYSPPLSVMTVYQIDPDGRRQVVEHIDVGDGPPEVESVPGRVAPSGRAWPSGIDELLAAARRDLRRPGPLEAAEAVRNGAVLVDIRPIEQRREQGEIPGAVVIPRNVLEWRLDPRSEARLADLADYDRQIIVVCVEGYASSLAAVSLRGLGLSRATDLDGGFMAWKAAGLPVREAEDPRIGAS